MQRNPLLALALLAACGAPADRPTDDRVIEVDLSHLQTVLSAQQIETLRAKSGLTEQQLAALTPDQADRKLRKLNKATASTPGSALEWRLKTMASDDGKVAPDGIIKALAHRKAAVQLEFDNGGIQPGSWKWTGPGNVGGRCRSLWIQPANPNVLVLGSVGGGLWRSTNAGGAWEAVDDFPASLAISCMAGPRNSNTSIWAGTGEGFGNGDSIRGAGIYRSFDAGRTFFQLPSTANSNFNYVNRIAFHPRNSNIVLAATASGLWRTTNGGSSWARELGPGALDVKFDPAGTGAAIRAGVGTPSVMAYVFRGSAWAWLRASGLPSTARRVELAYAPSNPRIVYASLEMVSGNSRVYRSTDGGLTYLLRSATGILGDQGWYDNAIWVDPTNANVVVVGGIGLYRSVTGGVTFTNIGGLHADQHHIQAHPGYNGTTNRIVYVCNDGGIYRTADIRVATRWTNLNNRIGITQFYGGAVSASGRPFGGTQDNGTQQLSSSTLKTFRMVRGADGAQCAADPVNFQYLYGETQYAGVFRSTTGGSTTESIVNNMADSGKGNAPFVGALRLDPNNPNRLWLGSKRLWRTNNVKSSTAANVSWRMVSDTGVTYSAVDIKVGNSKVVVAADRIGSIYRTLNGTATNPTWTRIDRAPLPNRMVTKVRIHPRDPRHIYVAFGGFNSDNVWQTTNAGATWLNISGSGSTALPPAPVRGLAVHPHNDGWIYAGTEVGIYASTDHGKTWSTSNDGPATVSVDDLVITPDGSIYAFTHGRGLYQAHAGMNRGAGAGTTRASLTWLDGQSNGLSIRSSVSGNGRYVAFASDATNLFPLDSNGRRDIFVRDRQEGTTYRESISTNGGQGNHSSDSPDISANGRFVAFISNATNLVTSSDTNGREDIFVRDRTNSTTERVSVSSSGVQGNNLSLAPSLNADGRYVVFYSRATNLVGGDTNLVIDVFMHDRVADTTVRVSVGGTRTQGNGTSYSDRDAISADGRFVVFYSYASNLVSGDTNGQPDIFLRDYGSLFPTTTRISVSSTGAQANDGSFRPSISGNGRYIVYYSHASNLVAGDTNARDDIFLYDRATRQTTRVTTASSGQGNGHAFSPVISYDGNKIAFSSTASNLVGGDTNGRRDIFLRTISPSRLNRISLDSESKQSNNHSYVPSISEDGKFVAYRSFASNLVNNDTNADWDIFVREADVASTVFPRPVASSAGSTSTAYPFTRAGLRLQQAARETLNRTMSIKRMSFRRDDRANNSTSFQRTIDLSLSMGNTDIDTMTSTFATNFIGTAKTVITRKRFSLPDWRTAPSGLARFDASFPLDSPYQHSGSDHLLWDMTVFANSSTGVHALDAHSANLTLSSTSTVIGRGCTTNTGSNFGHIFRITSDGPTTRMSVQTLRAPANAPVSIGLGFANPNLNIGLCTRIYTDAALTFPVGSSNSAGSLVTSIPLGAWQSSSRGLVLFTQAYSLTGGGFFSYGRRVVLPPANPGPLIRQVLSTSPRPTGILQNLGAVFKLDY